MNEKWMAQQATADYCGCSVRTVQLLTKAGEIPCSYALGPRQPRYDREAIDRWMSQKEEAATTLRVG